MTDDELRRFIEAAQTGDLAQVAGFLAQGAPPDGDLDDSTTLQTLVAFNGHAPVLERLLAAGSDVNRRTRSGMAPIHAAALGGHAAVIDLLHRHGADLNALVDPDLTPLRLAIESGHVGAVRRLCELGADPDRPDAHGATDRLWAAYRNVPLPFPQSMPKRPGGPLRPPSGTVRNTTQVMAAMSEDDLEAAARMLPTLIAQRLERGEITAERAQALTRILEEFQAAQTIPDLGGRTTRVREVMDRVMTTFVPEGL